MALAGRGMHDRINTDEAEEAGYERGKFNIFLIGGLKNRSEEQGRSFLSIKLQYLERRYLSFLKFPTNSTLYLQDFYARGTVP